MPMQFTRKAEYSILALMDLAMQEPGEYVLSRDVAARQRVPVKFIAQIMAALSKAGWVEGQRGSQGGVRLGVAAEDLSLLNVIEAIDGPLAINPCLTGQNPPCPQQSGCPLHGTWAEAQRHLVDVFGKTSIKDLASAKLTRGKRFDLDTLAGVGAGKVASKPE